jgi:diguanylate cyclase (GGDEF)-like protein
MPIRARLRAQGRFTLFFGVCLALSLLVIALAGSAIGRLCSHAVRDQGRADARSRAAQVAARIERDAGQPLAASSASRLRTAARRALAPGEAAVTVADRTGRVIFPVPAGESLALTPAVLRLARPDGGGGQVTSGPGSAGPSMDFVFAPRSGGVLVVSLPYAPIAAQIDAGTDRIERVVLGGLLVVLLALWIVAVRVWRRVRRELRRREEQGNRDPLTGLPNREQLQDLVHQAIVASRRADTRVALMLMDLNSFKEINDTLGHHNGDRVLQQLASRLRAVLRENETIARLGGDEFAILVPAFRDQGEVVAVAERILKALEEPFVTAGLALEVDASIGIALFPDHGDRVAQLLRAADVAMYLGKESLAGYTFFSPASDQSDDGGKRLTLIGELRSALERRELVLYYQPKVELPGGRVAGVEALVRWQHHRGGLLTPDEFIPLLEQSSLLREVTLHLVETALRDCGAWRGRGHELAVAVNLSMRNLLDSQLPAELSTLVRTLGLTPDCLELEITESMLMSDPERIMRVCNSLRRHGFKLTVDDFGTGYSSLAYLQRLPVTALKVDKSFVTAMDTEDGDSATIVRSTVDLAHNLGLAVVAEGVESEATYNRLASLGCDMVQGFLISRPMPQEQLLGWLDRHAAEESSPANHQTAVSARSVALSAGAPADSSRSSVSRSM